MNIGENIKKYRKDKKMSQRALAKTSEVSFAYIQQLEKEEKRNPSIDILNKIAEALGISVNKLLGIDELEEEIAFLSNVKLIDIDYLGNSEYTPENSNIIRRDIIKIIKHLKYDTKDLSRETFDNVVKSVLKTIDYEFYNINKNKSK